MATFLVVPLGLEPRTPCQIRHGESGALTHKAPYNTKKSSNDDFKKLWSHLGLNQGLPDYESGALTN